MKQNTTKQTITKDFNNKSFENLMAIVNTDMTKEERVLYNIALSQAHNTEVAQKGLKVRGAKEIKFTSFEKEELPISKNFACRLHDFAEIIVNNEKYKAFLISYDEKTNTYLYNVTLRKVFIQDVIDKFKA